MLKVSINGEELEVQPGSTIMQACKTAGIEVPHFCYHERLAIAGNCRMCLVEVEKSPKPVASCVQAVTEGMVIKTNTPMVKKAREGVMEFLLINHPLDCPICDQAGECDLQDQSMHYGKGTSRFNENKRAVTDKYIGPLVATHMTRCIHCTRCVRFLEDVAGVPELGAVERGEHMQISTYVEKSLTSELSGNIIDLCPVGALTSKPYEFKARTWELRKTESIDVLDAVGSNIRIDSKGREVMRILPRLNEDINEEWIADKTRFAYDGLKYQRLDTPMVKSGSVLKETSWEQAFANIKQKINGTNPQDIGAIAGDLVDVESMLLMKEMLNKLGSYNHDCRQDGSLLDNTDRSLYIFNSSISGIAQADTCIIFGANPRVEAAILNARIGKNVRDNNMSIALIGEKVDLTYNYKHLGNNPWILKQIANGEHPYCKELEQAKKPMLILGADTMASTDFQATIYYSKLISKRYNIIQSDWNGYNVLQRAASRVGGLDIGFIPPANSKSTNAILKDCKVLFLMGADEVNFDNIPENSFVIYIGHHGDRAAARADVILPGAAYTEKNGTYVNLEGRVQHAQLAVHPHHMAQEDWKIIAQLAQSLNIKLLYYSLFDVRRQMANISDVFKAPYSLRKENFELLEGKKYDFIHDNMCRYIENYYMSDPISRSSKTMAQCMITLKQQAT